MAAHGSYGRIRLFNDFAGPEIPVANAVAYGTSAGGCNYYLGDFAVKGDLGETDTGVVALGKAGGYARVSGNNEDGKGVALTTDLNFSPALSGTMAVEARVELQALTTRVVFVGFCGTIADDVAEPVTATGTTLTLVAANLCGFLFDSQLTDTDWHCVYNGGATTGATDSTTVDSGAAPVAAESDILRLEIDPNGTARYWINGDLVQTTEGAVSTTVLQGGVFGCWGTTTTAADADFDYVAVEAHRDWTR